MERKTFFNDYYAYNEEGSKLSSEARTIFENMVADYHERGYNLCELQHIICGELETLISFVRIKHGLNKRVTERQARMDEKNNVA